jgi:hypothetical protein
MIDHRSSVHVHDISQHATRCDTSHLLMKLYTIKASEILQRKSKVKVVVWKTRETSRGTKYIPVEVTAMSGTQSQALPAQPDAAQISSLVSSIVSKAREGDSLSSLTPRLVRSEVENRLEIPSGTLDLPAYRALVRQTIHDAMASGEGGTGGKISKKGSKLKVDKIGHSSSSKSIKSKVRRLEFFDCLRSTLFCRKSSQTLNVRMDRIYPPFNAKRNQTWK